MKRAGWVIVLAVAAGACSSTATTITDGGATTDATQDSGGGPCKQSTASFTPTTFKPAATPQQACTPAQIAQLEIDCDGNSGAASGLDKAACTAHSTGPDAACFACYETESSAATWGAVVKEAGSDRPPFLNQAGCVNLVSGVAGCGEALINMLSCMETACPESACGGASGKGSSLDTCWTDSLAAGGGCDTYKPTAECLAATASGKPADQECFPKSSSPADQAAFFGDLVGVFCNGAVADAGDG